MKVKAVYFWFGLATLCLMFLAGYYHGQNAGKTRAWQTVLAMVDENPSKVYRMATGNYLVVIKGEKGAANGR